MSCFGADMSSKGHWRTELGPPVIVAQAPAGSPIGNDGLYHFVRLFRDGQGRIVCRWAMRGDGVKGGDWARTFAYAVSTDEGRTWGPMQYYPISLDCMIPLADGGLLGVCNVIYPAEGIPIERGRGQWPVVTYRNGEMSKPRWSPVDFGTYDLPPHLDDYFGPRPHLNMIVGCQGVCDQRDRLLQAVYVMRTKEWSNNNEVIILASSDHGATWSYAGLVASYEHPADAKLGKTGYSEAGLVELADGRLLCVMRTEYQARRLMAQSWSANGGKTWTRPVPCPGLPGYDPTTLSTSAANVSPWLTRLDNGVVAISYGRPGVKVAFSFDGSGRRWEAITDIVDPETATTAMTGIVPLSENTLLIAYDIYGYRAGDSGPRRNTIFVRTVTLQRQ